MGWGIRFIFLRGSLYMRLGDIIDGVMWSIFKYMFIYLLIY